MRLEDLAPRHDVAPPMDGGMLREIAAIGFHPFILVHAVSSDPTRDTYLVCKTQNEAPEFVHEAPKLPGFSQSRLVRGIERALQLETYEAAELLFEWTKALPGELPERVFIGLAAGTFLPSYAGYPMFTMGSAADAADRETRTRMLVEAFHAYRGTPGNDALRLALVEALGFALSRALGSLGWYAAAVEIVDEALEFKPYSIHLKAAKHALGLKQQGGVVPERLAKFIGEDNGYLKPFVCLQPFKRFDIGPSGDVLVCCGHWLPTSIGNFIGSPVEAVLNSPMAQKIRQSVTDGSYKYCNHLDCGEMIQNTLPRADELKDPQVLNAIARKDFQIDSVDQVLFALDRTCNLSCPSCRTERISEKMWESEEKVGAVDQKLLPLLPKLRILNINPAGELFASRLSRNVLKLINDESAPDLVLDIISNGTLFSEEEWNKFPGIHRKIRSVRISTDAASKESFEKLRRGGRHDVFLKNMQFLATLRASGVIPQLKFSFTYQRDNFREMREFVAYCERYNADFAIFERLQNLGAFTDAEFRERAVHIPGHPLYEEFLAVIRDPIFRSKRVWHDFDYPGVENMSADEARARLVEALQTPAEREKTTITGALPSNSAPNGAAYSEAKTNPPAQEIDPAFRTTLEETLDGLRSRHLSVSWGDRLLTIDKTAGFKRDPAFASAFDAIKGSINYDEYAGPDGIAWRLNTLCWAAKCALSVGGDFVECGVHKGDMAWVVLNAVGPTRIPCFWLFDSFQGFSPKYSSSEDFPLNPGFLEFANKEYQEPGLYERVRNRFAAYPNVRVIKGFLPEALDIECPERIGFLHVDLNSPRAEIAILERLFDRVVHGGVIVFDDYGWKLFEKQKAAEDGWLAAHGYEILELPTGQGLVIKR